jgi:hypothetical protein
VVGGELDQEGHPGGQLGGVKRIGLFQRLLRLFRLVVGGQGDRPVEQSTGLRAVTRVDREREGCGGGQRVGLGVGAGELSQQVREPVGVRKRVEGSILQPADASVSSA